MSSYAKNLCRWSYSLGSFVRHIFPLAVLLILLGIVQTGCDDDCPAAPIPSQERITGRVINTHGPVPGVVVEASSATGQPYGDSFLSRKITDSNGRFDIPVPIGGYFLRMKDPIEGNFIWYTSSGLTLGHQIADTLKVLSGCDSIRADFILGSVEIQLQRPPELSGEEFRCRLESAVDRSVAFDIDSGVNSENGVLETDFLPPGQYFIKVIYYHSNQQHSCFWLPSTLDPAAADAITIYPQERTTWTENLFSPCYLQGQIDTRWVEFEHYGREISFFGPDSTALASHPIDDQWQFSIPFLAEGHVRLKMNISRFENWVGGDSYVDAREYALHPGTTVTTDSIPIGGIICHLSGNLDLEWYSGEISVYTLEEKIISSSDGANLIAIPFLAAGEYKLRVQWRNATPWRPQWYHLATHFDDATPIVLENEGSMKNIDITLERGGRIAGTVLTSSGGAANRMSLRVKSNSGDWSWTYGLYTFYDGTYLIEGLPDGEFIIGVRHASPEYDRITWYPGVAEEDSAQGITIIDASDVVGIDFQMLAPLDPSSP
ncbi:MAG: carboxypeptidase-like regulatory domain-containing protein [Candidatus Eisenbacteria bacterium]|nr:carboxypeptidase-like regulatory domain-containing protein [Candidatus Eisenbacteria bacterium]